MAFEHYTRCVKPEDFVPRSFVKMAAQAAIVAAPFTAIALATGHLWCLLFVAEIYGLAFAIFYSRNFLYERLICLGGDEHAVGALVENQPPPGVFEFDWDNDYSINLLLQCTEFGVGRDDANNSQPFGRLIAPNDLITNPPLSRSTLGKEAEDKFGTKLRTWALHAEFEGAGVYNLLQISQGMMGFAVGGFLACIFLPTVISIILAIFVFLASVLGMGISKFVRPGSPSDTNPNLPTLAVNTEDNGGHGKGADILYVEGAWVHDPLHGGRNELHPIKACCKIGTWNGDWTGFDCGGSMPPPILLRLRQEFEIARAEETRANQKRPEHQWQIHPDLDGCASDIIL